MKELQQEMIVQTNDIFTKKLSLKTLLRMNTEGLEFKRSAKQGLPFLKGETFDAIWCGQTVKKAIAGIKDPQELKTWFLSNIDRLELGLLQKSNNWVIYIQGAQAETIFSFTTDDIKNATSVGVIK